VSVAIIDYGSGNLRSAAKAFERAAADLPGGIKVAVTADPAAVLRASHIVLPGVGAFADCMAGLAGLDGMIEALQTRVRDDGVPFLGICVGMQLMATMSREHGRHDGLGWLPGTVAALTPKPGVRVPHMGWNALEILRSEHPVVGQIAAGAHAYFVHGYAFAVEDPEALLAQTDYGGPISAIVGQDNILGTQFHPEKSQQTGLDFIGNFLNWRP
jgi:glutamine amidotransferase